MPTQTPWGQAQYRETHFKGCTTYGTASHGGLHISSTVYPYLSDYTKSAGLEYSKGLWYEEDCDYLLPVYELYKIPEFADKLKDSYTQPTLEQIKQWFPDYPEEVDK